MLGGVVVEGEGGGESRVVCVWVLGGGGVGERQLRWLILHHQGSPARTEIYGQR